MYEYNSTHTHTTEPTMKKNIKVNIVNEQGRRTSTTLNYTISFYFYRECTTNERILEHIKQGTTQHEVTSIAQQFTNDLQAALGTLTRRRIEYEMMDNLVFLRSNLKKR